ncbi:MAG: hypothetical protein J5510_02525 [Prevotella sp.]|nr:hypothetical protein [Prevotella sp.]
MTSQREQQLINDALAKAFLTQLPEPADSKTVWIEGIAKIRLADGSTGYGIVKRNAEDFSVRVCYVNGNIASIREIEEVYPYITLQKDYIKKFSPNAGTKPRIEYLESLHIPYLEGIDLSAMDIEQLNREIVKAGVYRQMKDMSR